MAWYWLGLILLVLGVIEYFIQEYQQLLAVRLRISQTIVFATLHKFMDLIVEIFVFAILLKFYEQVKAGNFSIDTLLPYLLYLVGCVGGTAFALLHYKKYKKTLDKKHRLQNLEKARSIRKQLKALEEDLSTEVEIETEAEFENDEEPAKEKKDAPKEVHNKTEDIRPPVKKEEHNPNPPQ